MQEWLRTLTVAGAVAVGGMAVAGTAPAQAEELRIAIGLTGESALVRGMHRFAENIAAGTNGEFTGRVFPNTLLNFAESPNGVRDGIADVAYVVPAYTRAEFAHTNLPLDMATVSIDPVVITGAVNDYVINCAPCMREYAAMNQVFLGMASIGPYYMMSKPRIVEQGDFRARKIRGFGPFGRWVEAMGATSVSLSANDIYESISQGQLDGNTHTLDVLRSLSLGEVTDYLLNVPIGIYTGNSMFNLNRDVWNDLSEEQKRAFLLAGGDAVAWTTVEYYKENLALMENPSSVGVELVEPSDAVRAATEQFWVDDLATVATLNREQYGIDYADDAVARMNELVAKWEALTADIDKNDPQAVADLFNREIFSKVDLSALD